MGWFDPPVFIEDRDKTRRAAVLNIALVTLLLLTPVIVLGNLLGGRVPLAVSAIDAAVFAACLGLRAWMKRGAVDGASRLLLGIAVLAITLVLARLGTVRAPAAAMYLLVIVSAGLLTSLPGMITAIAASSVAVAGLVAAANAGWLPPPNLSVGITQIVSLAAIFAWTGGLMYSAITTLRGAILEAETEIAARLLAEKVLARHLEQLEETVRLRTSELSETNRRLKSEVEQHARSEEEVRDTLRKVKSLSGMIPICMHCKKIRDDKGYWQQVEAFVRQHSAAEFSHGLCPACLVKHYPEYA